MFSSWLPVKQQLACQHKLNIFMGLSETDEAARNTLHTPGDTTFPRLACRTGSGVRFTLE
jgi:hypothetical protein